MSAILTSVILCTRNRPDDVKNFLKSLARQTCPPNELIVVDSSEKTLNNNPDFNLLFDNKIFPGTKLIYRHSDPGLTLQRNIGISLTHAEVIYFFDDDTILNPDYLEKMNEIFINYPEYGGGMGYVTNLEPKKTGLGRIFRQIFLLQRDYSSGKFTASGMPTHTYGITKFRDIEVLGGCCMAYRSYVFFKNRFDENLRFYGAMEDCDFSKRVSQNCKLFYNPEAKLQHLQSPINRDRIEDLSAMYIKNYSYLFFKNFYPENRLRIFAYYWSIAGLLLEAKILKQEDKLYGYLKGLKERKKVGLHKVQL